MTRIGITTGCFDLFHPGHAAMLRECMKHCDYLIVGVNTDESIRRLKGPDRPRQHLGERMDNVINFADMAFAFDGDHEKLLQFGPHVAIRGWDQDAAMLLFDRIPVHIQLPRHGDWSTTSEINHDQ